MKAVYTGELSDIVVMITPGASVACTRDVPVELPDKVGMQLIRTDGTRWRSATPEEIELQQIADDLHAEAERLEKEAENTARGIVSNNAETVFEEGWAPLEEPMEAEAVAPATGGGGTNEEIVGTVEEKPDGPDLGEKIGDFADDENTEE
jgi:hypothetical protein